MCRDAPLEEAPIPDRFCPVLFSVGSHIFVACLEESVVCVMGMALGLI